MELRTSSATDRGRVREQNEDSVLADAPLLAVADGMGGHKAGEVASRLALEVLATWKDRLVEAGSKKAGDLFRQAFDEANRTVYERGREDDNLAGMGTTLTAAIVAEGNVVLGHVGDSRAYLLRGGKLEQLTHDQNVAQDLVRRGRLSEAEAATSPHRHVILQAVGADPDGLDIEVTSVELRPGDRFLLATDGLFGMVKDADRIRDVLIELSDPDEACARLITDANEAGGEDNISVLIADVVGEGGAAAPAPADEEPVQIERQGDGTAPGRGPRSRWVLAGAVLSLILLVAGAYFVMRVNDDTLLVAERGGTVVVVRGSPGTNGERATGDVIRAFPDRLDRFPRTVREDLREGIPVESMREARQVIADLPRLLGPRETPTPVPSVSPGASPTTSPARSP